MEEPAPIKWATRIMPVLGLGVVLLGAYVGGGRYLHCTSDGEGRANCTIEVRRWLGRSVVESRAVAGVTEAAARVTPFEETYKDAQNRDRTRTREAWSLELAQGATSTESVAGLKADVQAAEASLKRLLSQKGRQAIDLSFSEWKFALAAMAFGAVWFLASGAIALSSLRAAR